MFLEWRLFSILPAVLIVITAAAGSAQVSEKDPGLDPGLRESVEAFLNAVKERDKTRVISLLARGVSHSSQPERKDRGVEVLWIGEMVRFYFSEGKSVLEIIEMGDIQYVPHLQADGSYLVNFIPLQYIEESTTWKFFTTYWQQKFFTCEFGLVEGQWKIINNLCFSGTEGPFFEGA